jgi:DNA-binding LacI/PurR family transcriptional regulator
MANYDNIEASITIDYISAACSKSRTTVSAVLRGEAKKYRISDKTAEQIRSTAEQLGWKPNFFARSLNKKKTKTIGVVFPDVFERFMGETIRGIETALQSADYRMLLSTSRFDWKEELYAIENFRYRGVDGFIIVPCADFTYTKQQDHAEKLIKQIGNIPCVILDRSIPKLNPLENGYGFVVQADYIAASNAVRYLAKSYNPKIIGYLGFNLKASSLQNRLAGFRDTTKELGITSQEILLDYQNSTAIDISSSLLILKQQKMLPLHWLVSTEGLSYRLASLLEDLGYRLGYDMYIARFGNDIPFFKTNFINIPQPHMTMGKTATELLLELINKKETVDLYKELPIHIENEIRRRHET